MQLRTMKYHIISCDTRQNHKVQGNLTTHTGFLRAPFSSMHLALDSDISTLTIKYQVELYTFGEFYESVIFLKAAISIKN